MDLQLQKVGLALCEYLGTPLSLEICHLIRSGRWFDVCKMHVDPHDYQELALGAEMYRRDAQAVAFFKKSPLVPAVKQTVLEKDLLLDYHECEERNLETNRFLDLLTYPSADETVWEGRLREILVGAEKILKKIVGPVPDTLSGAFGPGSSFELGDSTFKTVCDKMSVSAHVTAPCAPVFRWLREGTMWDTVACGLSVPYETIAKGNRFASVPKTAVKRRPICIEPLGNLYCQLAIGSYWKQRLLSWGISVGGTATYDDPVQEAHRLRNIATLRALGCTNLPSNLIVREDGQQIHRRLAQEGSLTGVWATIDLSSASDLIARNLVKWVAPTDWFALLDACRSPYTLVNGTWHRQEKFSSMGNGFTFELLTGVLVSLMASAFNLKVGVDVFAYGDDLILPREHYDNARVLLESVGLLVNNKKSFADGGFRESCGGDYMYGIDVRPLYSKAYMHSPLDWYVLHNSIKAKWPGASKALRLCVDAVPRGIRFWGPAFLGDRVLHGHFKPIMHPDGYQVCKTLVAQPNDVPLDRWSDEVHLASILYGSVTPAVYDTFTDLSGYRVVRKQLRGQRVVPRELNDSKSQSTTPGVVMKLASCG